MINILLKLKFLSISIAVFVAVWAVSCDLADDELSGPGTLKVYLTDAPAHYEAVYIDIQEVRVHFSPDAEEEDGGWITISDQPLRINLLDFTNGRREVLGEGDVEPGRYNQMRLVLGPDNEVVIDGQSHPLTTPSGQQSGLKLNIHADIESGRTYSLLLDFDASRSVVQAGQSGQYILKPVLRTINLEEAGAIAGTVEPEEALPWVYAIDMANGDTLTGTLADPDGMFLLIGVPTGTYDVAFDPSTEGFSGAIEHDVPVSAPDTTFLETVHLD